MVVVGGSGGVVTLSPGLACKGPGFAEPSVCGGADEGIYEIIAESWCGCSLNLAMALQLTMSFQSCLRAKLHNIGRRAKPVTLDTPE